MNIKRKIALAVAGLFTMVALATTAWPANAEDKLEGPGGMSSDYTPYLEGMKGM